MSGDIRSRLAALSPAKRSMLEKRLRADRPETPSPRIPLRKRGEHPPLSFAQQRLWFLEQLEPGGGHYNLPLVLRLNAPVDAGLLEAAINDIVARHEILRTRFVLVEGEPCQEIVRTIEISLEQGDLTSLPPAQREAEAGRRSLASALLPFDLRDGPLIRAQLLRLGPADHLLTVTMHHIVADGWSLGVFARELSAIYAARSEGRPQTLPPLPLQYADFALWQRDHLQGETLDRLTEYWTRALAGMPTLLELPTDRVRPRVQTFEGGMFVRPYPKRAIDALSRLAQRHDATLFMALLAVFKILLHRLSGQTDIVVGSPIANRGRVELESLIGFFVNTMVLRTDLAGDPDFAKVLGRVRDVTLGAYAHQDLPFEQLVEKLNPSRSLDHNPLFQVMFGMQNTEAERPGHDENTQLGAATSKFDLTVSATETAGGLTCAFEFASALFDAETITALADTFGTLIEAVIEFPDMPVSRLPLAGGQRRAQLIEAAATPGAAPAAATVHDLFALQSAKTPDAIAIAAQDRTLSYAESDREANRLARALGAAGVGPGAIVGLCMRRDAALPIAMLAIWKAGAAFLPLDPALPADRLGFMLADAGAALVLTHGVAEEVLAGAYAGPVWRLDRDAPPDSGADASPAPPVSVPGSALAYVIYTSGSTGRPKGVLVTHEGAANALQTLVEAFALPEVTRVLQFGSLSFDISIFDVLMAWGCGGTLCIADADDLLPGPPLADTLRTRAINAITLPPSALAVTPVTPLPALTTLVCGGEALSAELASAWAAPGRSVINAYGPTETTIWATYHECREGEGPPPIGRAVTRVRAQVLDRWLQPLPPGFPGELYIGGAGVALGYLGRPALTAERFVPDPFANTPGARLYRTGDRAILRADGSIRFIGRADHQIKLRGYRIELGEIESVASAYPEVAMAAAVIERSRRGEPRILLACVPRDGATLARDALLDHLRAKLPEFMLPARLLVLAELPRTGSGKIDRKAIARIGDGAATEPVADAEGSPIEREIAALFAEVLEVPRLGRDANFFELGGHSLLATRAVMRLNERFGIALPLRELFEYPVVGDLARLVERARDGDAAAVPPVIARVRRRAVPAMATD